jgi:hypothetical protein
MPKDYQPSYVQDAWYSWWEKSGYFKPEYNEVGTRGVPNRIRSGLCWPELKCRAQSQCYDAFL